MSSRQTIQRRLSLLAGSSLVAASLSAFAFTGAALTPTRALAANECSPVGVDPSANPGPDSYVCDAPIGTYTGGVTYSSDGDLSVESTIDNNEFGGSGIVLTGNGADNVTFLADGVEIEGRSLVGALLDVTTDTGDIDITTEFVDADGHIAAGVTHGIRAISTGGGDVSITAVNVQANVGTPSDSIGIEARSAGGDVVISTGGVSAEGQGIVASTTGAGSLTLNLTSTINPDPTTGTAGVNLTTETGALDIIIDGGRINSGAGVAILAASGATVDVDVIDGTIAGAVDFSGVSAGGVRMDFTDEGVWLVRDASVFSSSNDVVTMSDGGVSTLSSGSSIDFGAGNDTWTIGTQLTATDATIDFGAGSDAFTLSGVLAIDGELTIDNLEAFNNPGVIYLGGTSGSATDGFADDVLTVTAGTFTGSGDSRIVLDTLLGGATQAGCDTIVSSDCLDLRGASTAGTTVLTVNDINPDDAALGFYDPTGITLVDVSGDGTSAAGDFTLDPNSSGYLEDPTFGAMLSRPGLFRYALRYDPATQRHALVGLPRSETMEYAMLSSAAQSIWHMTTDTVTERQGRLRGALNGGALDGGALWMRTTGEYTKRDVPTAFSSFGDDFVFDNSYKLYAGTIMGGLDLIQGRSGDLDYVVGAQIGYVGSSFDLNNSPSSGRFSGATGGVYGSIWNERMFLDATFNMNGLTLDYDAPGIGSKTNTYTTAFGGRLEGGMRWDLSEVLFAEPLATVSFVRTGFEEISLSGGEVQPDDAQSRRAALGLRLGGDIDGQIVNWSYFVTGRAWNEFDGESGGVVNNPGADLPFVDEFDGTFGQVEAGLSLYNDANTLSGFASSGVKWKDGYSAIDLSLGLRMAW